MEQLCHGEDWLTITELAELTKRANTDTTDSNHVVAAWRATDAECASRIIWGGTRDMTAETDWLDNRPGEMSHRVAKSHKLGKCGLLNGCYEPFLYKNSFLI